jgi:hypothetical protein
MTIIDRNTILAEEVIREHVRKRIWQKKQQDMLGEEKIRLSIRRILEAETGTEEPSQYTGINVLADLLEKIVPVIESDYKMLTTSVEQRESFRNHIVHAMKNSITPIEAASDAEKLPENLFFNINKSLLEKIKIDLDSSNDMADPETIEGEFIDIDSDKPADADDFIELDDQNETGRNFAATTFKKVEKQVVDAYDMLADEEDQKLFYDYLITNILLYFDKFEDELQPTLPNTTTPEYEKEKEEETTDTASPTDADVDPDTDTENTEDPFKDI